MIDDVIDPRETRAQICRALELSAGKRVERPAKRGSGGAGLSLADPAVSPARSRARWPTARSARRSPTRPAEYAAEARRAVDEGAVHIHIHARRPDGTPSSAVEDFVAIRDAIVAEVGDAAIINFSTGTIGVSVADRVAYLEAGRPEVAALNMGSLNYAKYSRSRKALRLPVRLPEPVR